MNIANLLRFLVVLALLITTYSVLIHVIMEWEGRNYSWVTGFYWTMTPSDRLHGHRPAHERRHADQPRSPRPLARPSLSCC